jgi:hypothetical protein
MLNPPKVSVFVERLFLLFPEIIGRVMGNIFSSRERNK